ncbi:MAG: hypothetical protein L6R42_004987 [Xanthoria sp. 1 TBL-2021]|nr:MAG: hypothetical protein L6R42_004987 [Xanthoria sp. 1 TBL-2021]
MEKAKDLAKGGWHPKGKDGGRESWRGEHKGINQVAGWVGKGKDNHRPAENHVSRPLATLKDPDSFGPPPKNVNYHGGAATPNAITPDRSGLGAPLSIEEIRAKEETDRREAYAAEEAARKPAPPPVPYRVNTSGLSTSNLPKPPVRRIDQGDQSPASEVMPPAKPKPSLPPRLPPRQGSVPVQSSTPPPPPYSATPDAAPAQESRINQAAVNRLGSAGISVPGFGIANGPSNSHQTTGTISNPRDVQGSTTNGAQLSELQSRFSKFSTKAQDTGPPSQSTSLAEKQAAMRTAQSFRNDPSSVSLADARDTAATANSFRARHGDQVNAGWKSANAMNKKYDIANRANSAVSQTGTLSSNEVQANPNPMFSPTTLTASHKRPPPPPPQKPIFSGVSATSPPPVPLSSKPR